MICIISEQISEDRNAMARVCDGSSRTFQEINKELSYATIMQNLSSAYTYCLDGDVKHVDLKFGFIVKKPVQKSVIDYMKLNFTKEQCEGIQWLKGTTKFSAKQASQIVKGKSTNFGTYNPFDILSKDKEVVKSALKELFINFPINAKIFLNGITSEITEKDLEIIVDFLQQGILLQIYKYQTLDNSDIDEINTVYQNLLVEDPSPKESIQHYFENFFEIQNKSNEYFIKNQLEYKWKKVLDWIISESIRDGSIMIKWTEDKTDPPIIKLIDIKIIDIDTKLCTKISDYQEELFTIFTDYAEYLINRHKYTFE